MPGCSAMARVSLYNISAPTCLKRGRRRLPFMLLQAMLGLQQDAPRGKLYVDPALPDWLPDVTLTDLRLGRMRFDIRFWRDGEETVFEVVKGKRNAVERMSIAVSGNFTVE